MSIQPIIDLRSDTVTKPTEAMRRAMLEALVGDDAYEEDPTVIALEKRVAQIFGKEAGLFFPTGTMSNLAAVLAWCPERGAEVIVGDQAHIFLHEQAGMTLWGGISPRIVPNLQNGAFSMEAVESAIRNNDNEQRTQLICVENTHCAKGGRILPLSFLQELRLLSIKKNIPVHMDGARIWNAIVAESISPEVIGNMVDTISVCLSKGLGCPAGSLLIGPIEWIKRARRIRKVLGGGMRQTGILAAAGLHALEDISFLLEDHRRAKYIEQALVCMKTYHVDDVETNIVFLHFVTTREVKECLSLLKDRGILVTIWRERQIRLVLHRDVNDCDVDKIVRAFHEISDIKGSSNLLWSPSKIATSGASV